MYASIATLATTALATAATAVLGAVAAPGAQAGGAQPHLNRAPLYGSVDAQIGSRTTSVKAPWLDGTVMHSRNTSTRLGVQVTQQVMRMHNGNIVVLDASASSGSLRLFSPTGRQVTSHPNAGHRAAVNHDGTLVAWSEGSQILAIRADGTWAGQWTTEAQPSAVVGDTVYAVVDEGRVATWDISTGATRTQAAPGWLVDVNADGLGIFAVPQAVADSYGAKDTCYRLESLTRTASAPVISCDELRPEGFSRDGRFVVGTHVLNGDVAKAYARVNDARPMLHVRSRTGVLGSTEVRPDGRALYSSLYEIDEKGSWKQAVVECTTDRACTTASPVHTGSLSRGQSADEQVFADS